MPLSALCRALTGLLFLASATTGCVLPGKKQPGPDAHTSPHMGANVAAITPVTVPPALGKASLHADPNFMPPTGSGVVAIKPAAVRDGKASERDEFKPLIEAATKMDRFSFSCKSYTYKETYDRPDGRIAKTIYHYNAAKPPAERRAMVLLHNRPPTEKQKNAIAEGALELYGKKKKRKEWIKALEANIKHGSCHMEALGNVLKYTFLTRHRSDYEFNRFYIKNEDYGVRQERRIEYMVDMSTGDLVDYKTIFRDGIRVRDTAGVELELLEIRRTFSHAPDCEMPLSTTYHVRLRTAAPVAEDGAKAEGAITGIGRDFKKVTCYDDRLRVDIGEGEVIGME
ncbi:hypothetical protein OH491_12130 [Termitidicoccus mucosus]|uniref:hypothetical protein n=1 Tax=Termitidicoccus mucosus TaxID=1184151 RepID=UPI00318388CD